MIDQRDSEIIRLRDLKRLLEAALAEDDREIETLKLGNDILERELAINAKMLAKQCDLAREAETEMAELRAKVRRWKDAKEEHEKWRLTNKSYQLDLAHKKLVCAEAALRAAVEKKPANISKCPDCGREKAKDAVESSMGFCPKWWAIHDHDAHEDCRRSAVGQ